MEKNDVPTIKGKWVKPHPPVVQKEDFIEMPPELEVAGLVIDLAINVVYVNDCSYFHSIDRKIKFRAIVELGRRKKQLDHTAKELFEALRMILLFYNKADIKIDTVHAHN